MSFATFGLDAALLRAVEELGFEQPTPIQQQAIPPAAEGRDLLACAMTGSGKTAAFVLPILHRLAQKPRGKTRALILAPTRELAAQIEEHLAQLARHTRLRGAAVFGGVGMAPQVRAFQSGVDVLIATPGRLLDHFQYPYARLDALEVLVLDEADRMLDMGFLPDIRRVLQHIPARRQTMLFSATMPAPIVELAAEMLKDPARLNIERKAAPASGITHAVYPVQQTLKSPLLVHLLRGGTMETAVVFTRTKHRANRLADYLDRHGVSTARIHGNRSQAQRTLALAGFKEGKYQVLVATDIAARGIDIEDLSHVVNFDVPHVGEDYIHRVGRTARAEATGDAFTFVSPEEEADLRGIEKALGKRLPRVTAPGFDYTAAPAERPEVPIGERLAQLRAQRAQEAARRAEKAAAREQRPAGSGPGAARKQIAGVSGGGQPSRPKGPAGPGRRDSGRRSGPQPVGGRDFEGSGAGAGRNGSSFKPVRGR